MANSKKDKKVKKIKKAKKVHGTKIILMPADDVSAEEEEVPGFEFLDEEEN